MLSGHTGNTTIHEQNLVFYREKGNIVAEKEALCSKELRSYKWKPEISVIVFVHIFSE